MCRGIERGLGGGCCCQRRERKGDDLDGVHDQDEASSRPAIAFRILEDSSPSSLGELVRVFIIRYTIEEFEEPRRANPEISCCQAYTNDALVDIIDRAAGLTIARASRRRQWSTFGKVVGMTPRVTNRTEEGR